MVIEPVMHVVEDGEAVWALAINGQHVTFVGPDSILRPLWATAEAAEADIPRIIELMLDNPRGNA